MKLVSSEEMKNIENKAMEELVISSEILMENAAIGAAGSCLAYLKAFKAPKAVVFCAKGNNGGDGFAVARQLFINKIDVKAVTFGDIEKGTADCVKNYNIARKMGIPIISFIDENREIIRQLITQADLCVDALIGTGLKKALYPELDLLVTMINENSSYIIAVDVPTGINSDNGQMPSCGIKADETITFHYRKKGLFLGAGALRSGRITLCKIGINYKEEDDVKLKNNILSFKEAEALLPKRKINAHKGCFGKVFNITGSASMAGAAYFNCFSAYEAGAGIVKLFSVKECVKNLRGLLPEALTFELEGKGGFLCGRDFDKIKEEINGCSVIMTGSGMGKNNDTAEFLERLVKEAEKPFVIDADALNLIAENKSLLAGLKQKAVITPHIGEMSRLTGLSSKEISENTAEAAVSFSKEYGVVTVLKDFRTVIADTDGEIYINTTGSPAMAKGGSGDCLSGTIAALMAQGLDGFKAAALGCFINGLAGECAEERLGVYSVKARDIIESIPDAIRRIRSSEM